MRIFLKVLVFTALTVVLNKHHPSPLLYLQGSETRKVIILLLQEVKQDIVYQHAHLKNPRLQEELQPRIQAHILSVVKKVTALLEYQSVLSFQDLLNFLVRITDSTYFT